MVKSGNLGIKNYVGIDNHISISCVCNTMEGIKTLLQ